jgi:hypothetical protein
VAPPSAGLLGVGDGLTREAQSSDPGPAGGDLAEAAPARRRRRPGHRRLRVLGVRIEPLTAARLWDRARPAGLSLGDRCCLALAERLGCAAVTADTAWAQLDLDDLTLTVRLIR